MNSFEHNETPYLKTRTDVDDIFSASPPFKLRGDNAISKIARARRFLEKPFLMLIPGLGYIILVSLFLFGVMAAQSFGFFRLTDESAFTFSNWQNTFNEQFFDSLMYSLRVGILGSLIAMLLCYPLSMLIIESKGQKTLLALLRIPMFIPALVASFLLLTLVDYNGFINAVLLALGLIHKPLRMRNDSYAIGVIVMQIWKNLPIQMIIVYSSILSIRKDVRDAARNLGCRGLRLFWEITFPLTISSALVAILLVFIGIFGDFAISGTAGPVYPNSLSSMLQMKATLFGEVGQASCIGVIMVFVSILVIILYTWLAKQLTRVGTGAGGEEA
jgi:putative spermidine/putrescine transport system permease protein